MTHISRPLQIVLAAFALFVVVWFVALRGHSSGGESSGSSASPSTHAATAQHASGSSASKSAGSSSGKSLPGVPGLTRAIEKARGAVAQSQHNAQQLQRDSQAASSPSSSRSSGSTQSGAATRSTGAAHAGGASAARSAHSGSATGSKQTAPAAKPAPKATPQTASGVPANQALVESELAKGQTVIVLFWNPASGVDDAVRGQLRALQGSHRGRGAAQNVHVAVHEAHASAVGSFGAITHSLQIFQTPTLLVIAPSGSTKMLTGLVDTYAIQQAIKEARQG
jgi:hypothetical protein